MKKRDFSPNAVALVKLVSLRKIRKSCISRFFFGTCKLVIVIIIISSVRNEFVCGGAVLLLSCRGRCLSYRCSATIGVFGVFLDAVVHLKELRLSLGVVHRRRAVRSLQRVHGDIGGRQRSEGLESHGRSVA